MNKWKVPYVNYPLVYRDLGKEIISEVKRVMKSGDLILRDDVERFEENFAKLVGAKYAIGVNSCTDAMRLSLRAMGIGQDDEVITSSHTFLATLDAIVDAGAKPVLVDSGSDYNMDTSKIEDAITDRTMAIMPVHLNGRMCDMDVVMRIADGCGLAVINDAAQALTATFKGKQSTVFGVASCYSFFPAKILGTVGDGGAVVTNNKDFADAFKALRDYGRVKGQEQVMGYGYNSRLDNVHAAILNVKIKYVPQWIERRRDIASLYNDLLCFGARGIMFPYPPSEFDYYDVFQNYVVKAERRDELIDYLTTCGIETLVHWRTPLHKQRALDLEGKFPVTEAICDSVVSLPMYPELEDWQVEYVCDKIREFYAQKTI